MKTFSFETMASAIPPVYQKKAKYGKYGAYIWDPTVGSATFIFNDYGDYEEEWTGLRLKDYGRTSLLPYEKYALAFSWWAYRQKFRRDELFASYPESGHHNVRDLETGQMHPEESPLWMTHCEFLVGLREGESQPYEEDWGGEDRDEEDSDFTPEYSDLKAEVAEALVEGESLISIKTAVALVAHIEKLNDVIAQRAISDLDNKKSRKDESQSQPRPTDGWGQYFGNDGWTRGSDCLDFDTLNRVLSEADSAREIQCETEPAPAPAPAPALAPKKHGRKPKAKTPS